MAGSCNWEAQANRLIDVARQPLSSHVGGTSTGWLDYSFYPSVNDGYCWSLGSIGTIHFEGSDTRLIVRGLDAC